MSELQISLLFIGIAVVVAVVAYNGWQQRQYRRKFGKAFQHRHADVLSPGAAAKTFPEKIITVNPADQTPATPEIPAFPAADAPSEYSPAPVPDDNCVLPDAATDYIATLTVKRPVGADALARLWQQRFDFGKNIYVCGLNAVSGAWEKVIAEGRHAYSQFTLALQLVNRAVPTRMLTLSVSTAPTARRYWMHTCLKTSTRCAKYPVGGYGSIMRSGHMTRWEACRQRYTASRSPRRKALLLNCLLDGGAYANRPNSSLL